MKGIGNYQLVRRTLLGSILLFIMYPMRTLANSSWHWVTVIPMKVLPLAIILTLAIETWGVIVYGKVEEKVRAFVIVTFANIASFVAPYIYSTYRLNRFYCSGWDYAWERSFNSGPNYAIRLVYLMLTLCIEVPLVYLLLKNRSKNRKKLLFIVIIVNVITTIVVAVLERLICRGRW
ncbi:hypothetical protein OXPF_01070 [Oxobacter pfennigii]|uniref:Uncharacterized protein n=1 Tax=Oxobacter pfennigii TaxID=36849 RepID=A0A0P8WET0_9CLOT|nr:hypothetical protein [Oxobacter pfennigii]KPU46262.1 hypothetical protein OXPF_01070 [Oxobacter pfennigii]